MRSGKRKAPQSKNDREAEYGLFITNTSTNTPNCQVSSGSVGPGALTENAVKYVKSVNLSGASTTIDLSDAPSDVDFFKVYISGAKKSNATGEIGLRIGSRTADRQTLVSDGNNATPAKITSTAFIVNNASIKYEFHGEVMVRNKEWFSGSGYINGTDRLLSQSFVSTTGGSWNSLTISTNTSTFANGRIIVVGM